MASAHYILAGRKVRKNGGRLKSSSDAGPGDQMWTGRQRLALKQHGPAAMGNEPRQHVDGGRLAGSVRADHAVNVALINPQRKTVQREYASEALP